MPVSSAHINHHPPGRDVPYHSHASSEVVIYLEGAGTIAMAGRTYDYDSHSFTVAPLGVSHNLRPASETRSLCVLLEGHYLEEYLGVWTDPDGQMREAGERLVAELRERKPGYREICDGLGAVIAGLARRSMHAAGSLSRGRRLVNDAVAMIDVSEGQVTVPVVARKLCVSVSHLRHLFARHAPIPAVKYIQRARVRKAGALLLATDLPLRDIARACGFDTPQYFSRSFRHAMGVSPSSFRRRGGGEGDGGRKTEVR